MRNGAPRVCRERDRERERERERERRERERERKRKRGEPKLLLLFSTSKLLLNMGWKKSPRDFAPYRLRLLAPPLPR